MTQLTEWIDVSSPAGLRQLEFLPGQLKDTTQSARKLLKNRATPPQEQYFSQTVRIYKQVAGAWCELPALYLSGVRVLFQDPAPPRYGYSYVRMAVPSAALTVIAQNFATRGVHLDRRQYVQEERIVHQAGVDYSIFRAQLSTKVPVRALRDGQWADFRAGHVLQDHRMDFVASVVFKVDLKYRGARVADPKRASMSLVFTPVSVQGCALSPTPLDPHPPVPDTSPPVSTASPEVQPTAAFLNALR